MLRRRPLVLTVLLLLVFPLLAAPPVAAGHEYEQAVWFNWARTDLDILVHGVDDPLIAAAIRDGIESWEEGVAQLASPWLADSFALRVYFPALDPVPPPGFEFGNIDIHVVPHGFMAVHPGAAFCVAAAPMLAGWGSMYHTALHEIGHCLGQEHVFDHGVEYAPIVDALGDGKTGYRTCPSNLNIRVIERAFSGQTGQVVLPSAQYVQASC